MLSLYFLQVASHCHFLSVLDLYVFFFLLPRPFVCFFVQTRRAFAARLLYPRRASDSLPSSWPCCSLQSLSSTQKEAQCARKTEIQTSLWGPMAGWLTSMLHAQLHSLKAPVVDNHHPSPSYTATERDYRHTKPPYKVAILRLQGTFILWDENFIRHSPGQCVADGPQRKLNEHIGYRQLWWLWGCMCWRKVSVYDTRLILFGFLLCKADIRPSLLGTILIGNFWPDSSFSCCRSLSTCCLEFVEREGFCSRYLANFVWLPLMHRGSPPSGSCYNLHGNFWTESFFSCCRLLLTCGLVFVKTSLQACVAGCFHLRWHFFAWVKSSVPSSRCCLW